MPRTPTDEAHVDEFDEHDAFGAGRAERRVYLWRYWQARRTGVDPVDARRFAGSTGDLGTLRSLIARNGCPPQLAVDILV